MERGGVCGRTPAGVDLEPQTRAKSGSGQSLCACGGVASPEDLWSQGGGSRQCQTQGGVVVWGVLGGPFLPCQ